jgi:PAS domain S-box-containing protein
MRVGELARRTGVGVSTLRAWENRFRFLQPQRSPAGHRLYGEIDVERVNAVKRLVGEGLTLPAAITRVASAGGATHPAGEAEALLYGQILEAVGRGVWVVGHGQTRYANRRMAELMRCSLEQLVAYPVHDIFDPQELPLVRDRTETVRAGNPLHFTQELGRPDGSTFLAEVHTTPLVNQAGRYEASVAVVSDVTARTEADTQAQLPASLLDSIGEAVAAATPDEKIVYVNAAAERLFGWRAADVVGQNGRALLAAPEVADDAERIHTSILEGDPYSGSLTMTRRDGSRFVAQLTSGPVRDKDGAVVGLAAVIRDQTEHDQRQRELKARELQAETLGLLGAQALRQRMNPGSGRALILTEAVDAARRLLHADRAAVLDVVGGDELQVRVRSPQSDERVTVQSGSRSFPGYVALARKAVVVDDVREDRRFDQASPRAVHPTASAVGAPVFGPQGIVAVLVVGSSTPCQFGAGDAHFVQAMANIIGTALLD